MVLEEVMGIGVKINFSVTSDGIGKLESRGVADVGESTTFIDNESDFFWLKVNVLKNNHRVVRPSLLIKGLLEVIDDTTRMEHDIWFDRHLQVLGEELE